MTTYILKEKDIESYYNNCVKDTSCIEESKIKAALMGLEEIDIEEAKRTIEIGDCILVQYDGKLLPYQAMHRLENGNVIFTSYYVLDNHIFDEKTNVWRDASIRRYMNEDMAAKFDKEFLDLVKPHEVHTDDYVTTDRFWLLSHEEIGYKDDNGMFKKNVGAFTFDYYKRKAEEDGDAEAK